MEEADPLKQALLEIYVAVATKAGTTTSTPIEPRRPTGAGQGSRTGKKPGASTRLTAAAREAIPY